MANAKKCDRCGKYYQLEEKKQTITGNTLCTIKLINRYGCDFRELDLCDDCAAGLWRWLFDEDCFNRM